MARLRANRVLRFLVRNTLFVLFLVGCVTAFNFPYDTGAPASDATFDDSANYYQDVYTPTETGDDHTYVLVAQSSGHARGIAGNVATFTQRYALGEAATLEVGAGSGTLQDVTANYTGLDIAESAARFFHKPFVAGSATELPFDDDSFDVIWTIWTLEHVPNPELALHEIRRVLKNDGYLYLRPVWNNPTWASEPFIGVSMDQMRLRDKPKTLGILVQINPVYRSVHLTSVRLLRLASSFVASPTRLRYKAMTPNYDTYAVPDADAVNSIDCFEATLWFTTRGDRILEQGSLFDGLRTDCSAPVLVQIKK